MKKIAGLFKEGQAADSAIKTLQEAGFEEDQFGLLARNRVVQRVDRAEDFNEGVIQQENGKLGAGGSAAVGGLTGLILGIGALTIPGLGPALAAGSVATTLSTLAAATGLGAASGGLLGALTSMGIAEKNVDAYAEGVKRGGILVVTEADDEQANFVRETMRQAGAIDIRSQQKVWQEAGWSSFDETSEPDENYPGLDEE